MKKIRILGNCQHWKLGGLSRKSGPAGNGVLLVDDQCARELIEAGAAESLQADGATTAPKPQAAGMAPPLSVSPAAPVLPEPTVTEPPKRKRGRRKKSESLL
jgi:hypothetical protein